MNTDAFLKSVQLNVTQASFKSRTHATPSIPRAGDILLEARFMRGDSQTGRIDVQQQFRD